VLQPIEGHLIQRRLRAGRRASYGIVISAVRPRGDLLLARVLGLNPGAQLRFRHARRTRLAMRQDDAPPRARRLSCREGLSPEPSPLFLSSSPTTLTSYYHPVHVTASVRGSR